MSGYCCTCNNTGEIDCHCGGDLCVCGQEVEPCPACDGGAAQNYNDDDLTEIEGGS
jgi:hypothetical protein